MGRNICCHLLNIPAGKVALRKESVDRNMKRSTVTVNCKESLSARRAWIEITLVASITTYVSWSLSARRAWIEIEDDGILSTGAPSRSPQGERG